MRSLALKVMEGEMISAVERDGKQCDHNLSDLPQHVMEYIFAKLPLHSISCSRPVCKEWNATLSSPSFLSSLSNPWLLLCGDGYCMAYCFSMQKWISLSLSFLPCPMGNDYTLFILSTSMVGLLLRYSLELYVCNPLTGIYKEIDLDVNCRVMGIVQGNGEPYLVVKFKDNWSSNVSIQIYHYFQDSWRIKFESSVEMGISIYHDEMVECDGVLFWSKCPIGIVACSIQDDSFTKVRIAEFSFDHIIGDNDYRSFMVAYGSSVLVVIVVIDDLLQSVNLVILELFRDKEDPLFWKWRLFARIPPPSIPQYFEINYGSSWQLECVRVGDYLYFSSVEGKDCPKIASYNLREGFWQCLPQCPGTNFSKMMSFEPKLIV